MLLKYNIEELRSTCRYQIENFELWAKRLIHEKLESSYGTEYFDSKDNNGQNIIKREIRDNVKTRFAGGIKRHSRYVDALLIEEIIDLLCNPKLFKNHFRDSLIEFYPEGNDEVRTFLNRLIEPRNKLSHSNPISSREIEQVICYTNDFIQSLKNYYERNNEYMTYNVPQIIKVTDSWGNEFYRDQLDTTGDKVNWFKRGKEPLRPGDIYWVEVTIDPSFDSKNYTIEWYVPETNTTRTKNKNKFSFKVTEKHVRESLTVHCTITSNKSWHRHGDYDELLIIWTKVLPPIE